MNKSNLLYWVVRLIPAIILLQTLFYKFTAAPESVYIFETLGLEPFGRIGIGVVELVTAILILIPRTTWIGAVLGVGIMSGAIFSHLTQLGIEVKGDGGLLFGLAVVVLLFCMFILWTERTKLLSLFSSSQPS